MQETIKNLTERFGASDAIEKKPGLTFITVKQEKAIRQMNMRKILTGIKKTRRRSSRIGICLITTGRNITLEKEL